MNRKVTVVGGAGNVGMTVARAIAEKALADVVIIDIAETKAAGVALDIYETCPIIGSDSRVIGGADWNAAAGSDIVVITSGKPRKPGMSRDDLVRDNFEIMKSIAPNLVQHTPNAVIVPVVLWGTENVSAAWKTFSRADVHVKFGTPFRLPEGRARTAKLDEYTDEIMTTLAAMLPDAYRGVYKDHPLLAKKLMLQT